MTKPLIKPLLEQDFLVLERLRLLAIVQQLQTELDVMKGKEAVSLILQEFETQKNRIAQMQEVSGWDLDLENRQWIAPQEQSVHGNNLHS